MSMLRPLRWLRCDRKATGENHLPARIKHINSTGPVVKVEAITQWGDPVLVELSQDRFQALHLKKDEEVFLIPRDLKILAGARVKTP